MPRVNPAVLTWARETAALDLAKADQIERVPQFWDWLLHRLQRLMSYRSIPSPVRRAT
jgi:hypothetical protein